MVFNKVKTIKNALAIAALSVLPLRASFALPFNDDMVNEQLKTGQIMRAEPLGSVALGSLERRLESKQEVMSALNPLKDDQASKLRGKRLFFVNCSPCHGDIAQVPYVPGVAGKKIQESIGLGPPDISGVDPIRQKDYRAVSDGDLFGTIHFGFGLMPAVGWKLSAVEKWDIVNYIRGVQAAKH